MLWIMPSDWRACSASKKPLLQRFTARATNTFTTRQARKPSDSNHAAPRERPRQKPAASRMNRWINIAFQTKARQTALASVCPLRCDRDGPLTTRTCASPYCTASYRRRLWRSKRRRRGKTFGVGLAQAIFGAASVLSRSGGDLRDRVMKKTVHRESQHARTQ